MVIISLVVAAVAFTAGTRANEFDFLASVRENETPVSQELPEDLTYTSVERVYDKLRYNFDGPLEESALLDGLKSGLVNASGDPYTTYLDQEQADMFDSNLNGTFVGIGAEIGKEDGTLIVVAPLEGFPAQKAGLRAQDKIIKIDGQETFEMSIEDAVLKIRGEEGTSVTLTILRGDKQLDFEIERAQITVPSVEHEILDGNIGYLRISRFAEDTTKLSREAAAEFKNQNVQGVILDLRNNSGGFLETAVDVSGLWLEDKLVVEQRENNGSVVTADLESGNNAPLKDMPSVVLVNEGSASASEIVAGALQDYDVATLIGKTTYGKGSVQQLVELGDGSVLKVTIARWYTPKGQNIDEEGIEPDKVVELTEEDIKAERDRQRQAAIKLLQNR